MLLIKKGANVLIILVEDFQKLESALFSGVKNRNVSGLMFYVAGKCSLQLVFVYLFNYFFIFYFFI